MTILKQNTFEGGTAGAAITTANSGGLSGDAFTVGTGTTYASTSAHGSVGMQSATGGSTVGWGSLTGSTAAMRFMFRESADPTTSGIIACVFCATGYAFRFAISSTTGKLFVQNSAGGSVWTAATALSANTWYRVEAYATIGSSTSNGSLNIAYYLADSATAVETFSTTTANLGTSTVNNIQFGMISGAWAAALGYDDVAISLNTGFIGPFVAGNNPPTCSASASPNTNVAVGATVTLTGTDADSDGTIASRQWTQTGGTTVTLTGATTATATFTAPSTVTGDTLTFSYTVTDNGGATGSASVSVTTAPAPGAGGSIIRSNTAEGGTNGTTVTTGNSGGTSGTAWDLVSIPAGQTLTYSTTQAQLGSFSYNITCDASTSAGALLRWGDTLGLTSASVRLYVWLPTTLPTVNVNLAAFSVNNSGTISGGPKLVYAPTGKLAVQDAAGTNLLTFTAALPTQTWVRLEMFTTVGTGTTDGVISACYATGTGAATQTYASSTVNAGTGTVGRLNVGKTSGTWSGASFYMDNIAIGNTAAFIGPNNANSAPTCTAAASPNSSVEPGATVTLTGTDADSDGTIASRQWTQTGGVSAGTITNATTQSATFTAPGSISGTTLTFKYAVTDNGGGVGVASTTVAVLPSTERAAIGGVEVPMLIRTS